MLAHTPSGPMGRPSFPEARSTVTLNKKRNPKELEQGSNGIRKQPVSPLSVLCDANVETLPCPKPISPKPYIRNASPLPPWSVSPLTQEQGWKDRKVVLPTRKLPGGMASRESQPPSREKEIAALKQRRESRV